MVNRNRYGLRDAVVDESGRRPNLVEPIERAGPHLWIAGKLPSRKNDVVASSEAAKLARFDRAASAIDLIAVQKEDAHARQQLLGRSKGKLLPQRLSGRLVSIDVIDRAVAPDLEQRTIGLAYIFRSANRAVRMAHQRWPDAANLRVHEYLRAVGASMAWRIALR